MSSSLIRYALQCARDRGMPSTVDASDVVEHFNAALGRDPTPSELETWTGAEVDALVDHLSAASGC